MKDNAYGQDVGSLY